MLGSGFMSNVTQLDTGVFAEKRKKISFSFDNVYCEAHGAIFAILLNKDVKLKTH